MRLRSLPREMKQGVTNFALPDLRGRIPIHFGTGPGLTRRNLGESGGAEAVAINTVGQLPSHSHTLQASSVGTPGSAPHGKVLGVPTKPFYVANPSVDMHSSTIDSAGKSQGHNDMMPSLCVNFIIALTGIYPSRN